MNTVIDKLTQRNETFSKTHFSRELQIMPSLKTTIIGCVDPRVDPNDIFDLSPGEAAVIRNVGGRVFPSTIQTLGMLGAVAKANGGAIGEGWNLIVLHHTDCGISCLAKAPELLAKHFSVEPQKIESLAITDPYSAVAVDIAMLKDNPQLPAALVVTGLVYDVTTGKVTVVVPSAPLRSEA